MWKAEIIWYRVLPQGEHQFLFAVRVGWFFVVLPIFSTSKMKAFCIYFYQGNITFKNIINFVSFIINLVEYLCMINTYSVTVLENFRKEISDRVKRHLFLEAHGGIQQPHLHSGESLNLHGPPSWMKVWWRYHFDSLDSFLATSLQVRELCSCFAAAWCSQLMLKQYCVVSQFCIMKTHKYYIMYPAFPNSLCAWYSIDWHSSYK